MCVHHNGLLDRIIINTVQHRLLIIIIEMEEICFIALFSFLGEFCTPVPSSLQSRGSNYRTHLIYTPYDFCIIIAVCACINNNIKIKHHHESLGIH